MFVVYLFLLSAALFQNGFVNNHLILIAHLFIFIQMVQPNIVLLITDDQDIELGSMAFMPKTLRLLQQRGTEFRNAFVSTPICCPSRSTILTGLYAHNHKVMTNNGNCAGEEWRSYHEKGTFAVHLEGAGFVTGFFGKYLNAYDGSWVPPGWTEWAALVHNSRYYNYSLNRNGRIEWHGNCYESDYLTDVVANLSLQFIEESVLLNRFRQPFLVVLSFPAPHGPEDPAPKFANHFSGVDTHRTTSWNYAPNPDKQWLLKRTGKMEPVHVAFTDQMHRRRLQTLQSVDDAVNRLVQRLRFLNQLHNTFILYTSDHGYHLGQFGLVKGKSMPYEFDIRVPLFIRGPGIPRGKIIYSAVSNIDIAPTILDIAGLNAKMDGQSMLKLEEINGENTVKNMTWRETVLIERGKMPKLKRIRERVKQQKELLNRKKLILRQCANAKHRNRSRTECDDAEKERNGWQCAKDAQGKWHIIRCPEKKGKMCECEGKRREKRGETKEGEEHFWRDMNMKEVLESGQWHQGMFKVGERRQNHGRESRDNSSAEWAGIPCRFAQMNCFVHSADHWRTPPFWPEEFGRFCFCQNANNNSYWCLRTVNASHNFLYCEFVTEEIAFYDLKKDPYQLVNAISEQSDQILEQLNAQLHLLKLCENRAQCEHFSSGQWATKMDNEIPKLDTPTEAAEEGGEERAK